LHSEEWIHPVCESETRRLYQSPVFASTVKVAPFGYTPTIANASPGPVRTTFSSALSRRTFFDALSAAFGAAAALSAGAGAAAGTVAEVESGTGTVGSPPMGSAG
jgi:hypothetical protein